MVLGRFGWLDGGDVWNGLKEIQNGFREIWVV